MPAFEDSLETVRASRDTAQKAYDDFVAPFKADDAPEMTGEEVAEERSLHAAVVQYEDRELDLVKDEKRSREIEKARRSTVRATGTVKVNSEPRVYDKGSDNSFYFDMALMAVPRNPKSSAATERMNQYAYEVASHIARDDKEGKRAKRQLASHESTRQHDGPAMRALFHRLEERGRGDRPETRAPMSTALGFGGELVTPVYLEQDVVPYREAGRAFADSVNRHPLPDYGMTVYLPYVASPAGIAAQGSQNSGIQETDPTTGYLSSNLTTEAGQVTLSQQLLDRAGPNFAFDLLVFDQLQRDYNPKVDTFVLTAALANANAVTYTASEFLLYTASHGPSDAAVFSGVVAQAKSNIRTTAGTYLNPTHLFMTPGRAEYMTQIADANGRPLIVERDNGPYNAAGNSVDGDYGIEGDARFRFLGLPVFTDNNIPVNSSSYEQILVLDASQVWFWEGTPVTRAVPQTLANDLSVLLQMYSYVGAIVPYPKAVQAIAGTATGTSISWT